MAYKTDGWMDAPWIGVDLDGTLFEYHEWIAWNKFGKPIPKMMERVKAWVAGGQRVKIFTARVCGPANKVCKVSRAEITVEMMRSAIQDLLEQSGLPRLEVTAEKDYNMVELWDDRAIQVVPNTGLTLSEEYEAEILARTGKSWKPGGVA